MGNLRPCANITLMINLKEMSGCGLAPTGSRQGLTVRFCVTQVVEN